MVLVHGSVSDRESWNPPARTVSWFSSVAPGQLTGEKVVLSAHEAGRIWYLHAKMWIERLYYIQILTQNGAWINLKVRANTNTWRKSQARIFTALGWQRLLCPVHKRQGWLSRTSSELKCVGHKHRLIKRGKLQTGRVCRACWYRIGVQNLGGTQQEDNPS